MIATSILEMAYTPVAEAVADAVNAAGGDATALTRLVAGLSDGNYYGRYQQKPTAGYAPAATSVGTLTAQALAWRSLIATFAAMAVEDSGDAANFIADLVDLPEAVRRACADPADAIRLLSGLAIFDVAVSMGADGEGVQISGLAAGACRLFRAAAAIALARAAADYIPSSQQDAATVRDQIAGILDDRATEMADVYQDPSAGVLDALRVAVVNDLTLRGASLAPVVERDFAAPLPACVIAYRLYSDASRETDLVTRNEPPHPGFMPRQIEALSS